jgi:predicted nucleic acid-binding Zn finger protein
MEALVETTGELFPAHTYLLDGNNLVAYVKVNTSEPFYFKQPIKGFDKRGRKFIPGNKNLFTTQKESHARTVIGSKGQTYTVTENSCSCPGYTYRGTCKHLAEHV